MGTGLLGVGNIMVW